jgi:hypothetical protein
MEGMILAKVLAIEWWSKKGLVNNAIEGLNFKGLIFNQYNGYGNKNLRFGFHMHFLHCAKKLNDWNTWIVKDGYRCNGVCDTKVKYEKLV